MAGGLGGLIGVGGGVLMVPLMVELMKVRQHHAHGTSLVAIVFTGLSGAVAYALQGSVDWLAAVFLASSAVLTAKWGARWTTRLSEWQLKRAFGAFLLFVAAMLLIKSSLPTVAFTMTGRVLVLLLTGGLTGFLAGMMGVGGGLLMVPAMVLLAGEPQHTAQGTSLVVMVPTAFAGAWEHWRLKHVEVPLLPGLGAGVLVGASLGAHIAHALPEPRLRFLFAMFVAFMGWRFLRAHPTSELSQTI